ncbi:glutamate racemase [Marinobacter sp.]|uniref:glutamate racemase n=1 Tax=Marinobacter sp. TaxID=50741 RepID=UPI00384F8E2F
MRPPEILVFDSGVGGLSVAQCIAGVIPAARLTYVADNLCFPYGDQPEAVVVSRCVALIRQSLAAKPADVVVIACNTASTVALTFLRQAIDVPVVGVVPAIKPAAALSVNRRIGLLATPATVRRPYLDGLIAEFASDCTLERVGHPDLVHWIEAWVRGESDLPGKALERVLQPFRDAGVDTIVLGCTHYPLILAALQAQLPEVRHWVDSGEAVARRTLHLLQASGFCQGGEKAGAAPVVTALFTGEVPAGIGDYLAGLGLVSERLAGNWPAFTEAV